MFPFSTPQEIDKLAIISLKNQLALVNKKLNTEKVVKILVNNVYIGNSYEALAWQIVYVKQTDLHNAHEEYEVIDTFNNMDEVIADCKRQ